MNWDPKNPVAPFTPDGSLQHYPETVWRFGARHEPDWREVRTWTTTLTLVGHRRVRSAAYFIMKDSLGREFPMMLADFSHLVMTQTSHAGRFTCAWKVRKRGQNYGIASAI